MIISGDEEGQWVGRTVDRGGDFNGDGYDDIVVGSAATWGSEQSLILGSSSRLTDMTLSEVNAQLLGEPGVKPGEPRFGMPTVGDVNGDGYDDLAIGTSGVQGANAYILQGFR